MSKMMTREEYLADGTYEGHCRYYAQFVTEAARARVRRHPQVETLVKSKNHAFNDPESKEHFGLSWWGQPVFSADVAALMRAAGDYPTLAGMVCIMKEAARQVVDEIKASRKRLEKEDGNTYEEP